MGGIGLIWVTLHGERMPSVYRTSEKTPSGRQPRSSWRRTSDYAGERALRIRENSGTFGSSGRLPGVIIIGSQKFVGGERVHGEVIHELIGRARIQKENLSSSVAGILSRAPLPLSAPFQSIKCRPRQVTDLGCVNCAVFIAVCCQRSVSHFRSDHHLRVD